MPYRRWLGVGVIAWAVSLAGCARLGFDSHALHPKDAAPSGHFDDGQPPDKAKAQSDGAVTPSDLLPADGGWFPMNTVVGSPTNSGWKATEREDTEVVEGVVRLAAPAGFAIKQTRLPAPRAWASAAVGGPHLFVIGGGLDLGDKAQSKDVLRYDPIDDKLALVAQLPDGISQAAAVGTPKGLVYSIKGKNAGFTLEANVFVIGPNATGASVIKATAVLEKAFRHTAALGVDGLIYVLGGVGSGPIVDKIEAYDPALDKMLAMPQTLTSVGGREHARAATADDGTIYVFGGALGRALDDAPPTASDKITDQILAFHPKLPDITQASLLPLPLMNVALGKLPDGRIVIVGGDTTSTATPGSAPTKQVLAFDPKTPTAGATPTPDVLPHALSGAAAALGSNGKLYLFGGLTSTGLSDEILELRPYAKAGLVSGPVTDLGAPGQRWKELAWVAKLPPGTAVLLSARASDTAFKVEANAPAWQPAGEPSPAKSLPAGRFVQWRAQLTTSNSAVTPQLLEVRCAFLSAKP